MRKSHQLPPSTPNTSNKNPMRLKIKSVNKATNNQEMNFSGLANEKMTLKVPGDQSRDGALQGRKISFNSGNSEQKVNLQNLRMNPRLQSPGI